MAKTIVKDSPLLRTVVGEKAIPIYLETVGFQVTREQVELHAPLGGLPPVQGSANDFEVVSLAEQPEQLAQWLDVFNQGLTVFWDIPPLDTASFQRLRETPGFDPSAFRLGIGGGEPAAALFYSVMDSNSGMVRINAAATASGQRSKGYGRRMIKDALNHLEKQGFSMAVIYTDAANQATNLLFKMLGFRPACTLKILENQL